VPDRQKLELRRSHRRILSALLRGFEDMRSEIERWIDPEPGVLVAVEERLGAAEQKRLRALLDRLGQELRRIEHEIALDVSPRSAARSIEALVVEHLSLLEETAGGELRGYGELDPPARARLETEFARLHGLFGEMLEVVRRSPQER
jgi:uncharacterized membrane-anchored protein